MDLLTIDLALYNLPIPDFFFYDKGVVRVFSWTIAICIPKTPLTNITWLI